MIDLYCFYMNQLIPLSEVGLPLNDLGVQRGYGIFDFLRINQFTPIYCNDHIKRFLASAKEMRLSVGKSEQEIQNIIHHLIQKNQGPSFGILVFWEFCCFQAQPWSTPTRMGAFHGTSAPTTSSWKCVRENPTCTKNLSAHPTWSCSAPPSLFWYRWIMLKKK